MTDPLSGNNAALRSSRKVSYGWIILSVCTLAVAISYGTQYSYSVFFKPLVDYFGWDRSTVSSIYSVALILRGATSIGIGWLADRYGAIKIMAVCGCLISLGLILSSQVTELWQLYLTYGLIEAIGLGGAFAIGTAITSRWFIRNRGLALGILASGSGLGTLFLVPGVERLISTFNWSMTFIIVGITAGLIVTGTAFLLKPAPDEKPGQNEITGRRAIVSNDDIRAQANVKQPEMTFRNSALSKEMILLCVAFFLSVFCIQMIMIHLVNFATDTGISPLQSAGFISIIGAVSIAGRLIMGRSSDKIGVNNSLIICSIITLVSLILLLFTAAPWQFYLFAVVFGFAYGGEIPLMPMFVAHFFGTRDMATLMGLLTFVFSIGGALGAWTGGIIYDTVMNYHIAFVIAVIASLGALSAAFMLKRYSERH